MVSTGAISQVYFKPAAILPPGGLTPALPLLPGPSKKVQAQDPMVSSDRFSTDWMDSARPGDQLSLGSDL